MAEELLRLPSGTLKGWTKRGGIELAKTPSKPEQPANINGALEKARQLFGENFLGEEAIHTMEQKCQAAGIKVKFDIPPNVSFTDAQLEAAKPDSKKGRERMIVLRPGFMVVGGKKEPITLLGLRSLFGDKNPFGKGQLFWSQDWYNQEAFAKEPMQPKFGLPTKEVVPESLGKNWNEQQKLISAGETRREAIETIWDTLLYYATTGKKTLETTWDWTKTQASDGRLVSVGVFDSEGLLVHASGSRAMPMAISVSVFPGSFGACLLDNLVLVPAQRAGKIFKKCHQKVKLSLIKLKRPPSGGQVTRWRNDPVQSFRQMRRLNRFGAFLVSTGGRF